jgi:tetratricopeptide (TPR) repeat protein
MKQDLEYTVFIERYLRGEMIPDELNWFEKEIEGNQQLRNDIKLHKKIDAVLSDSELIELKNQLELIHQEIEKVTENGQGAIRKIYKRVYYSSAALVVGVFIFTMYLTNRNFTTQKLIDRFYEPEVASVTLRGTDTNKDLLAKAMTFYNHKEYGQAIEIFESILNEDESKIGLNLYSGISHMEIEKFDIANERFQRIIDDKPNPFVESATWYLGMCYLQTENKEKALEQFEALVGSDGFYKKEAKRIIRRMK